jgi:hypothetical protein
MKILNRIKCYLFGHQFRYIGKRVTQWTWNDNIYECDRCNKYEVTHLKKSNVINGHLVDEDYNKYAHNHGISDKYIKFL